MGRDGVGASFEDEGVDDELDKGIVAERVGALDASRLDADWEGPSSAATCAEREMNFLYSYLSAELLACARYARKGLDDSHRMYFSSSLSRSESIMFVGGGCLVSSGLKCAFDLMFPFAFMT